MANISGRKVGVWTNSPADLSSSLCSMKSGRIHSSCEKCSLCFVSPRVSTRSEVTMQKWHRRSKYSYYCLRRRQKCCCDKETRVTRRRSFEKKKKRQSSTIVSRSGFDWNSFSSSSCCTRFLFLSKKKKKKKGKTHAWEDTVAAD